MPRVNPPRVNLFYHPYALASGRQCSACCCGVARQLYGSRQKAAGVSGVLSLRHFGLVLFIHIGAWVPKNLARRIKRSEERRVGKECTYRAASAEQKRLAARSQQLVDAPR